MWTHSIRSQGPAAAPLLSYTRSSQALFALSPLLVTALFPPTHHILSTLSLSRYLCSTSALSITSSKYPRKSAFSLRRCSLCMYHLIFLVRSIMVWIGSSNCRFFYPMHSWCATVNMLYLFLNNQALILELLNLLRLVSLALPPPVPTSNTPWYSCYLALLLFCNQLRPSPTTLSTSNTVLCSRSKQTLSHQFTILKKKRTIALL